jgi:hypothetical protein
MDKVKMDLRRARKVLRDAFIYAGFSREQAEEMVLRLIPLRKKMPKNAMKLSAKDLRRIRKLAHEAALKAPKTPRGSDEINEYFCNH